MWILNRVEDDGVGKRAPSKTFTTFTQSEHYLETSSYPTPIGHPGERSEYL